METENGTLETENYTLETIAQKYPNARRSGSGWKIPCPAHNGEDANCYLAVGDDGGFIAHCHSKGCSWADIMDALGLPKRGNGRWYIASYRNRDGQDRHVYRRDNGQGKQIWGKGTQAGCELATWGVDTPESTLVIVEGEKAAVAFQRARMDGFTAVTWRGGAKSVSKALFDLCKGREVLLWPDNDEEGRKAMQTAGNMAAAAGALSVSMLAVDDLPEKADAADLTPDNIRDRLDQLADWQPDAPEVLTTLTLKNSKRDAVLRQAAASVAEDGRLMALYDRLWRYDGHWQEVDEYVVLQALQDAAAASSGVTMHRPIASESLSRFKWLTRPVADAKGLIRREDRARNLRLDTGIPIKGTVFDDEVVWIEGGQLIRRPVGKQDFIINRKPYRLPDIASSGFIEDAKKMRFWTTLKLSFGDLENEKRLLLEFGGRVLMQHTGDQKMLVMKGPGRSGKGTFIRLLQRLVGPNQYTAFSKLSEVGARFQAARLIGKSLATIGDLAEKPRGSERRDAFLEGAAVMKAIVGEDAVTIEEKRKDALAAILPVSFVAATNHPPQFLTSGADSGAWKERMMICRFPHEVEADKRIEGLDAMLYADEGPTIAGVLVSHFLQARNRGYTVPASHVEEMSALVADATTLAERFVSEQLVSAPGERIDKKVLTERLFAWAEAEGVKASTSDRNALYQELRARGCRESKGGGKANVAPYFEGVVLQE